MNVLIRQLIGGATLVVSALLAAGSAQAQSAYPNRPIRIIVGYQAAGPTDQTARLIAAKLQASMGQSVVVENRTGAGSTIATEYVAASPPDGYTLLLAAAPIAMNGFLYKNLKYDVQTSLEPIVNVMSAPSILAVSTKLPVQTLGELIALAKARPGKLSFGSSGNGGSQHLAGELLKQRAGLDIVHIPYKGAAGALNDLMGGTVDMVFMTSISAMPNLKTGNPRPIAVAAPQRLVDLPQVPTMSEAGLPGFEAESWNGLFAPAKTPPEIVARLNAEVNKALASPDVRDPLVSQGAVIVGGSSADFKRYLAIEVDRWGKLLKTLKISLE